MSSSWLKWQRKKVYSHICAGETVHATNTDNSDLEPQDLAAMCKHVRHHVNYHTSFTYEGMVGVVGLDVPVPVCSVTGPEKVLCHLTLWAILCQYAKLKDGRTLIAEIHQLTPLSTVQLVIANTPEVKTMVAMMNRQPAVFLGQYLMHIAKLDYECVGSLMQASMAENLLHSAPRCSWDKDTWEAETPKTREQENSKNSRNQRGTKICTDRTCIATRS